MSAASAPAEKMPALTGRLSAWLANRTAPHLFTWVLLAGIAGITAFSLNRAAWVPDSSPLISAAWGGLLVGLLLAASRFRGRFAAGYSVLVAFSMLGLWIGKVLPSYEQLNAQPPAATLELLNIRLLTYLDRLLSWLSAYLAGGKIQDNGLFQLLIGLLVWASASWLAWAVVRRRRALDGLLPAGLLLGMNIYLSDQPVDGLWLFLGCAVLLSARTALVEVLRGWEQRRVDYPDELGWNWMGSAVVLGLIILLAARLAPVFGTPQGWKTLGDLFRDAQRRLEQTTTRLFGDVATPPPHSAEFGVTPDAPAPSADTPEMGIVGLAPSQSNAVVMWVKTSDPPPPELLPGIPSEQLEPGPIHYWRSSVFGSYTGRGWEGLEIADAPPVEIDRLPTVSQPLPIANGAGAVTTPTLPGAAKSLVPGRRLLSQEFEIVARHDRELFGASVPVGTAVLPTSGQSERSTLRYAGPDGTPLLYGSSAAVASYSVQSWVTAASDVLLRAAPAGYPPEIASRYLQLPSSLPQRVRDLARRVVSDAANPYDKAVRVQDYLRLSYPYDLQVALPPAGRDVVDYFLFDANGGFCSYYSSAMAVMLRTQGIAARVASGYATGIFDFTRRAYRVTPSNSHAWVEVYFSGYGWIEFEPTAGLERIGYETPAGGETSPAPLTDRPRPPAPAWQGIALAAAALVTPLALFGLAFWLRARRRRLNLAEPPERQAELHYLRLRRLLGWAGLGAPASATPAEYLSRTAPALQGLAPLPTVLRQATELYQQAVYSPHPPSYEDVNRARRLVNQNWGQWVRLMLNTFWERIKP